MAKRQENAVFKRDECEYMWVPKTITAKVKKMVQVEKSKKLKEMAIAALESGANE